MQFVWLFFQKYGNCLHIRISLAGYNLVMAELYSHFVKFISKENMSTIKQMARSILILKWMTKYVSLLKWMTRCEFIHNPDVDLSHDDNM